jgi:hypothetical protein
MPKLKLKQRGVNSGLFLFSSARLKCVRIDTIVLVDRVYLIPWRSRSDLMQVSI